MHKQSVGLVLGLLLFNAVAQEYIDKPTEPIVTFWSVHLGTYTDAAQIQYIQNLIAPLSQPAFVEPMAASGMTVLSAGCLSSRQEAEALAASIQSLVPSDTMITPLMQSRPELQVPCWHEVDRVALPQSWQLLASLGDVALTDWPVLQIALAGHVRYVMLDGQRWQIYQSPETLLAAWQARIAGGTDNETLAQNYPPQVLWAKEGWLVYIEGDALVAKTWIGL